MESDQATQSASVRMPAGLKRSLRIKAAVNDQSLSDEIIGRLQKSLDDEERARNE